MCLQPIDSEKKGKKKRFSGCDSSARIKVILNHLENRNKCQLSLSKRYKAVVLVRGRNVEKECAYLVMLSLLHSNDKKI